MKAQSNTTTNAIPLSGCAPVPLAHYLKALGVFRLLTESEHGDASATAHWKGELCTVTSDPIPQRSTIAFPLTSVNFASIAPRPTEPPRKWCIARTLWHRLSSPHLEPHHAWIVSREVSVVVTPPRV